MFLKKNHVWLVMISGPAGTRISNSQHSNFEINSAFNDAIDFSITQLEHLFFPPSK